MTDLTEASLTNLLLATTMLQPTRLVIPRELSRTAQLIKRSFDEGWDWRRRKRELRRAETSTYRRSA